MNLCISTLCLQLVDLYIAVYSGDWPLPPLLFMNCKEIIIFVNLFTVQNFHMNNLWQHFSLRILLSVHNKYLLDAFLLEIFIRLDSFLFQGWLSLSLLITSASWKDGCPARKQNFVSWLNKSAGSTGPQNLQLDYWKNPKITESQSESENEQNHLC